MSFRPHITYLFVVSGSHGHIFPAVKLALRLQSAGHRTVFVAPEQYGMFLELHGIEHLPVGNSPLPFLALAEWYQPEANVVQLRVINEMIERCAPDRIVTSPLVLSAFAASEIHQIPAIVIGYSEYLFPNLDGPKELSRKAWRLDELIGFYNRFRTQVGLPAVSTDPAHIPLLGDHYLQRSTPSFDNHQKLPEQVAYIGSHYWEASSLNASIDRFIECERGRNRPVWYVQVGRLFEHPEKWPRLTDALNAVGVSCVVDIGRADYLGAGAELPDTMFASPHIALGPIADAVTGVVCSGQTTSVLAALQYEKPIMCAPHSDDARELSARLVANGVGLEVQDIAAVQRCELAHQIDALGSGRFAPALAATAQDFAATEAAFWSGPGLDIFPSC